jgi:ankyrin repeat protein
LHAAAYGGHPEIIRFLLDRGARLTPSNWFTPTPLDVAEALHHEEAGRVLRSAAGAK